MKKAVAVFFGGRSTEHDISIITALSSVIKPLELSKKYTVVPVYITKTGKWVSDDKLKNIKTYQGRGFEGFVAKAKPVSVVFDGGMVLRKGGLKNSDQRIDVAFPAMHGPFGEDGSLMGLLRMSGIPYVGSDMAASVVAMDKVLAKQVIQANGILTPNFFTFTKAQFESDSDLIIQGVVKRLHYPLFVKPAHLGSSIGITRVTSDDELHNAIEVAIYYDDKVVVEEAVENLIEVTVPIIGNAEPRPALVERALAKSDDFFDFETKYLHGGGKKDGGAKAAGAQGYSELPAKLPGDLYDKAVEVALASYQAVGCEGIARIDLLIDSQTSKVYFNEINPLPGSLYAHNWRAAGLSSVDLVSRLVELAEERFAKTQKLETTFSSSFLQQF